MKTEIILDLVKPIKISCDDKNYLISEAKHAEWSNHRKQKKPKEITINPCMSHFRFC